VPQGFLDSPLMAILRATRGKVLAYRANAHHLIRRLPAREWSEAFAVGLQDTPPGSALLALAARVEGADAELWENERVASRDLVVSWALRGAPYAHLMEDHDRFSVAARPTGDQSWLTLLNWTRGTPQQVGMAGDEAVAQVASEVEALLRNGPMTKPDLSTALRDVLPSGLLPWCRGCKVHHVSEQVLRVAALFGGIVFGPDLDGSLTLARADEWLEIPASDDAWAWRQPDDRTARYLRLDLLHRYLTAYGPADPRMFAGWLGVTTAEAAHRFAEAEQAGHLVPVATAGRATGWLHTADVDDFQATKTKDARGVRLIPPSDPYLQQRDRDLLVAEPEHQKQIWASIGGAGVVLIDATAAGTWRAQKKGPKLTITVRPFDELRPKELKALDAEAANVARVRGTELAGVAITG
jgi:hypothetical protein